MSTLNEFLVAAFENQHSMIDTAVKGLTADEVHWLPPDTTLNHIGNTLWHYVRTEDNIIQFVLQDRKPTVWIEGGYHEKFGLDKIAQGTGMSTADAQAMRMPTMADWMGYQNAVWEATTSYVSSVSEEDLTRIRKVVPFGDIPAWQAISISCITHGHAHFGEISIMRVLQGLPSTLP